MSAPSKLQQKAANPEASVWVTANAGAGKTRVLVDRVIRLLLAGTPPQRILCLTFTHTAAAEMANRLLERLGQWALSDDATLSQAMQDIGVVPEGAQDLAPARRLFATALETPGGLKIQTIHAFCESLLKRFPVEAGISPYFQVIEEKEAQALRHDAFTHTVIEAADNADAPLAQACRHIARLVRGDTLTDLIEPVSTHRHFTPSRTGEWTTAIATALGVDTREDADTIRAEICRGDNFDDPALTEAVTILATGSKDDRKRGAAIDTWLSLSAQEKAGPAFAPYRDVFLTKKGSKRERLITKALAQKHPAAKDALEAEQERLAPYDQPLKKADILKASSSLSVFAHRVGENYRREKMRRGVLDFDDLITRTRSLLAQDNGASWVMYKLDGGIDHILVDEAQDTAPDQWQIITALSEEFVSGMGAQETKRTLFVVGDEKQSIYGFQGANPAFGSKVQNHLAEQLSACGDTLDIIGLGVNFRSTQAVLDVVDRVFADSKRRDSVTQQTLIDHRAGRLDAYGFVEWWPQATAWEKTEKPSLWSCPEDTPLETNNQQNMVDHIATKIAAMVNTPEHLETGAPIRPGDILILVQQRSGGIVENLTRALKRCNIAVTGRDRLDLANHLAVMDLCATARFALFPEDDLNLAAVLKGPLCDLGEDDLMDLCLKRTKGQSVWQALGHRAKEKPAWRTAHTLLSGWLKTADTIPPHDFFSACLTSGNGRRALLTRLGQQAEEPIDEFLNLCLAYEATHAPSLQGFLHWFERRAGDIKRQVETTPNAVRIMTVHSAKGLEAPVVFLADATRTPKNKEKIYWYGLETGHPIPLWPMSRSNEDDVCADLRHQKQEKAQQEYYRLLYVAMTRAGERLYVCGWKDDRKKETTNEKKSTKDKPDEKNKSWHDIIKETLGQMGTPIDSPFAAPDPSAAPPQAYRYETGKPHPAQQTPAPHKDSSQTLPDWLHRPAPAEAPGPALITPSSAAHAKDMPDIATETTQEGTLTNRRNRAKEKNQARRKARQRGRLIHRLLEILPDLSPDIRQGRARKLADHHGAGMEALVRQDAVETVLTLLDDPTCADVFAPGGLNEVDLSGVIDARDGSRQYRVMGRIDRLVLAKDRVLIVDYKSGKIPRSIPATIPKADLHQLALYRKMCQQIYPEKTVVGAFLWTTGPVFSFIPDAVLDSHEP